MATVNLSKPDNEIINILANPLQISATHLGGTARAKLSGIGAILICTLLLTAFAIQAAHAGTLALTLNVGTIYGLGETISVNGTVKLDGSPVSDALVALQIDDSRNNHFILRTLTTGGSPSGPWAAEILNLFTCDINGNPKTSFNKGGNLGLTMTIRNNGLSPTQVRVIANLYYSSMTPFMIYVMYDYVMDPQSTETKMVYPLPIPDDAESGQAFAYASAVDYWPEEGGRAYCPERLALFSIQSGGSSLGQFFSVSAAGDFTLTFRTNPHGGYTGYYNISASSQYGLSYVLTKTFFEVFLFGDVNGDGKVRVDDVLAVALAFGSNEGDPGWDPRCDLNKDGKVRVDDVLIVAKAFGDYSGS